MVEGVNHYIKSVIHEGSLTWLALHGVNTPTTHSQFVDDAMLQGVSTSQEALSFKGILNDFHLTSGTLMNNAKYQNIIFQHSHYSLETHFLSLRIYLEFPSIQIYGHSPDQYFTL